MKKIYANILKGMILIVLLGILSTLIVLDAKAQWPAEVEGSVIIRGLELVEKDASLLLAFDVDVCDRALNNRQSWQLVPELRTDDGISRFLPTVLVNGRQKQRHYQRKDRFDNIWQGKHLPHYQADVEKKDKDPEENISSLNYRLEIPYEDWMDDARLIMHQYLTSSKDKRQLFSMAVLDGVKLEAREPYMVHPEVNYITPEKEDPKNRSLNYRAFVDFPSGRTEIQVGFRNNARELAGITENIHRVYNSQYLKIERIIITGYSSPEGSYSLNERLSRERAGAMKRYLVETYALPEEIFQVTSVVEDWAGLSSLVKESRMAGKEGVMEIIDSPDAPDVKERKLKATPQWRILLTEYFPKLRRTEYRIDFVVRGFSLAESRRVIEDDPSLMSHLELFELAMSYTDPVQRMEVLEKALQQYPDDIADINNYSAILLENGELTSAKRYLDRGHDAPELTNNNGVYLLLTGDTDNAMIRFDKAKAIGIAEAGHNMEETHKKIEDNMKMERYGRR